MPGDPSPGVEVPARGPLVSPCPPSWPPSPGQWPPAPPSWPPVPPSHLLPSPLPSRQRLASARVLLLNPRAFALASALPGGDITLFLCIDSGEAHVMCMCLWSHDADGAERAYILGALHRWHREAVGPRGPTLVYEETLRHGRG